MKFIQSPQGTVTRTQKRSMQYYRLWIYSCNAVLGITSAIFAIFAAFVLTDVRLSLLGGVELYHPTFLYAYGALVLQCGGLQIIGCLGSKRLSQRLLSLYWIILLVLTIGDVLVSIVWIFKLEKVKLSIRPGLTNEFISRYSTDERFIRTWDTLQSEEECCGVEGPQDFYRLSPNVKPNGNFIEGFEPSVLSLPESCCFITYEPPPISGGGGVADHLHPTNRGFHGSAETKFPGGQAYKDMHSWDGGGSHNIANPIASEFVRDDDVYHQSESLQDTSDDNYMLHDDATTHNEKEKKGKGLIREKPLSFNNESAAKHYEASGHQIRHANHRLKVPVALEQKADNSSSLQALALEVLGESGKNKTSSKVKSKLQQKLLPSFTYPSIPRPQAKPVEHGESENRVPLPFTCRRKVQRTVTTENNNDRSNSPVASANGIYESSSEEAHFLLQKAENPERAKRDIVSDEEESIAHSPEANVFSFLHANAFQERSNGNSIDGGDSEHGEGTMSPEIPAYLALSSDLGNSENVVNLAKRFQLHKLGCGRKLVQWVDHVSGIFFILGLCIIGFTKVCFLVILRTEIREMIEKIQLMELENPASPSRTFNKVSHPLLSQPRASTVSAHACNAALPTIKSPEGSGTGPPRYTKNFRRHSNIIGERSSTHSQETVNMTLLVTNSNGNGGGSNACLESKAEKGRSNPNLRDLIFRDSLIDPVSISIPNTAKYLRRSSTCSVSAHMAATGYSPYLHYDEVRPGPSSRFYYHDTPNHHHIHHQHCYHGAPGPILGPARSRLYQRNMSIGAVVHHSSVGSAASAGFRNCGGGSAGGSANCSFSSRDENEILSASMENVIVSTDEQKPLSNSADNEEKEEERRESEIRDWAASTACTDFSPRCDEVEVTPMTRGAVSLGDYTKTGFNQSSDSAESNTDRGGRRNGNNNNVDLESIPLCYLGTAV